MQIDNVQLIEIKETSWFKRTLNKILDFFGRKNRVKEANFEAAEKVTGKGFQKIVSWKTIF